MKLVHLKDIANVAAGQGAPKNTSDFSNEGIPFVRAGSLDRLLGGDNEASLELVPETTAKKYRLKLYPAGSVLFAKSGMSATRDRVYCLKKPAYVVNHLAIIVPHDDVDPTYLTYALRRFKPSSLIKDKAYPSINLSAIKSHKVLVPYKNDKLDLEDQIRIATLLSCVEALIVTRKNNLQQLNDFLKSTFLERFGAYLRDESNYVKITDIADFIDYRGKTPPRVGRGIPLINAKCVRQGYFDDARIDYIEESTYKKVMTRGFPKAGDVLFTTEGATLGFTCRIPQEYKVFSVGQRLITLQTKNDYSSIVLDFILNHPHIQKKISNKKSGGAALGVRSAEFAKLMIPNPPNDLQNFFSTIVEKVEPLIKVYQQSLCELKNLYGVLSQKAFKGDLDLSRIPLAEGVEGEAEIESLVGEAQELEHAIPVLIDYPMSDPATREKLLRSLFDEHRSERNGVALSLDDFWKRARLKTVDMMDEDDQPWGLEDYERLKQWLFDMIRDGELEQSFVEDKDQAIKSKIELTFKA